jgi:hypothetical protein
MGLEASSRAEASPGVEQSAGGTRIVTVAALRLGSRGQIGWLRGPGAGRLVSTAATWGGVWAMDALDACRLALNYENGNPMISKVRRALNLRMGS